MKTIATAAALLFVAFSLATAQVPRTINYQGRAATATGPLENVTRRMTLVIYNESGSSLWIEQQDVAFRKGGIFTVAIGAGNPIPESIHFDAPYTFGVTIAGFNGGQELPRIALRTVPYAFHAVSAEGLKAPAMVDGNSTNDPSLHVVANPSDPYGYAIVSDGVDSTSAYFVAAGNAPKAPSPGAYYRDNAPVAWGTVGQNGNILAGFGIARTSYNANGQFYLVELNNPVDSSGSKPVVLGLSVNITGGGVENPGSPVMGQWSYYRDPANGEISRTKFQVRLYGFSGGTVQGAFSMQVFGRP